MAQQINLCTPILLKPKHYFSAQTMAQTLGVFAVLGGMLCAFWVWNLQRATDELARTLTAQTQELEGLQSAIQRSRTAAAPADAGLVAQLQTVRSAVQDRQKLRDALQQGLLVPGWGHSDRLQWVARSIPAPVWVTAVAMDEGRFEVSGFTLEPAALNEWVAKLASNPLMRNMKLATVKVESAAAAQVQVPAQVVPAVANSSRPVWSFKLLSAAPPPPVVAMAVGGKP